MEALILIIGLAGLLFGIIPIFIFPLYIAIPGFLGLVALQILGSKRILEAYS